MSGRLLLLCALLLPPAPARGEPPAPSPVIYPAPEPVLRFSHQKHTSQSCRSCHAGIAASTSSDQRSLPAEAVCAPCHPQTRGGKGGPGGCAFCHPGFSGSGIPRAFLYPTARLRFGHRLHLDKGSDCADCHRFEAAAPTRGLPGMATCMGCHQRRGASNRCVVCHLSEKDGRLRTSFGPARLLPSGSLRGDRHGPLFSRQHGGVARLNRQYCQSCHQPRSCLTCHAGTLRPQRIHPNDYTSLHALDARRDQTRCRSCHSLQTFCVGCHQRSGVGVETARSGFRPHTSRAFHPAGFADAQRGPGHHAYAARRNANACVSCHREGTCVRCHGSRSRGLGGFSPHPPGFATSAQCRSLAGRNTRACIKCHLPGDSRARCR